MLLPKKCLIIGRAGYLLMRMVMWLLGIEIEKFFLRTVCVKLSRKERLDI